MRLRNRIIKATFYTDPELLRWPRDKRDFYRSLWACSEDSCCLEDDMFGVKLAAWPSPADSDMTVESFENWRDELIEEGKVVRYEAEGKPYLYLRSMHDHEAPRNPQKPDNPLPPWVAWVRSETDPRKGFYQHESCTTVVQPLYNRPRPVLPCPVLPGAEPRARAREDEPEHFTEVCEIAEKLVGRCLSPKELDRCRTVARVHSPADVRLAAQVAREKGKPTVAFLAGACDNLTPSERGGTSAEPVGNADYESPAQRRAKEAEATAAMAALIAKAAS